MNAGIEIAAGDSCFDGHFPGQPILPGVALLDRVCRALAGMTEGQTLRGIAFARLRLPILPGDRLDLSSRAVQDGSIRVDLHRGTELVANAQLEFGPTNAQPTRSDISVREARLGGSAEVSMDRLLPHRPPMRLVATILEEYPDGLICHACIPPECALASGGFAPALATVEAAAQAAAAWEAVRRIRSAGEGGPRIGYLVALRQIAFFAEQVPAGRVFLARVWLEEFAGPLTHYGFEVSVSRSVIAAGGLGTYLAGK